MAQTSVTTDNEVGYEGRDVYPSLNKEPMSKTVGETAGINFGRVPFIDTDDKAYLLRSNQAVLTCSTDLGASNVLAGNLNVNGVDVAYTETYASSHSATLTALAVEIEAIAGVLTATANAAARTITVVADPETDIYFSSGAVTGGSAVTVTRSNTCTKTPFGVTVFTHRDPDAANSNACYYHDNDTATIAREIYIEMTSDDALAVGDSVYVRFLNETATAADKATGMLMGSAGTASSLTRAIAWTAASVYKGCTAGARAIIRVRI